jgi:hypothetical protein
MFRLPADPDSNSKVIFPDQWHGRPATPNPELPAAPNSDGDPPQLPALPPAADKASLACPPLVPERSDFLEGDAPAADKVEAFLTRALEASGSPTVSVR